MPEELSVATCKILHLACCICMLPCTNSSTYSCQVRPRILMFSGQPSGQLLTLITLQDAGFKICQASEHEHVSAVRPAKTMNVSVSGSQVLYSPGPGVFVRLRAVVVAAPKTHAGHDLCSAYTCLMLRIPLVIWRTPIRRGPTPIVCRQDTVQLSGRGCLLKSCVP